MVKFLETFFGKLLDFLNFGRLITIVVPGVIVSFCLLMFGGQLLFPDLSAVSKQKRSTAAAAKAAAPTQASVGKNANEPAAVSAKASETAPVAADESAEYKNATAFQKQLSKDFKLTTSHFHIIGFFTIVLGILLYELSYGLLSFFPVRLPYVKKSAQADEVKKCDLTRYESAFDAEDKPVNKFRLGGKERVFLEYFAPFLKEKFSGDENYYNFLILEYYRFVEFSVVMPVSIIAATLIGAAYWLLFCLRTGLCPYESELTLVFIGMPVLSILFIFVVSNRVWAAYQKSQYDLILGASDMMAKGLTFK